jgi:hypothetical protein
MAEDYGVEYEPEYWQRGGADDFLNSDAFKAFTSWADPSGPGSSGDPNADGGGANWLQNILSSLGPLKNLIGPALTAAVPLAGGQIGSNAARDASRLQSDALTRGMNLQEAQWLQQQRNQEPWMKAGREALPELQRLAKEGSGAPFQAPNTPIWGQHPGYAPPNATPGWQPETVNVNEFRWQPGQGPQASQYGYQGPQAVNAGDYRYTPGQGPRAGDYGWTPGQGPRAQDFRYTPGQTPEAGQYQSGPPQLYQGAMPGTQVSQLTGQQVLDQDPGAAFRQTEARKALESSALAKGMGMSGSTLGALQRQSQELASQEYGNAWQRMMARDTEQYGRDWGQYQQQWNQGVQGTQLGLQTQAQNFGQQMSAAQLREQVNQQAQQMGWTQAQAEAAFREQMAQASSQQGWGQAQGEAAFREQMAQASNKQWGDQVLQTSQWNQGQRQQYETELYNRMLQQSQERYGRDVSENQQTYDRSLQAYNARQGQQGTDWSRWAALSGVGQQATNQVGNQGLAAQDTLSRLLSQLGPAQAQGPAGSALSWQNALRQGTKSLPSILQSLNL